MREGQADTRAFAAAGGGVVSLVEAVENVGELFGGDAGAGVLYGQQ